MTTVRWGGSMQRKYRWTTTIVFAVAIVLGGAVVAQTPGEFPQGANVPKNMRAYFLCLLEKGPKWMPGAVCGPGDAGAPGVHSRASGSWKIRRGWASARSGTDRGNGDYQRGVDRR